MIGGNQIAGLPCARQSAPSRSALGAQELKLKNEGRVRPADDDRVAVLQHHVVRRLTHTDLAVANDRSAVAAAIEQDDSPLNPVDAEMFARYVMAARLAAINQIEIVQRWCMSQPPIELHLQFVEPAEARLAAEVNGNLRIWTRSRSPSAAREESFSARIAAAGAGSVVVAAMVGEYGV
jgi:hypothetical protein